MKIGDLAEHYTLGHCIGDMYAPIRDLLDGWRTHMDLTTINGHEKKAGQKMSLTKNNQHIIL